MFDLNKDYKSATVFNSISKKTIMSFLCVYRKLSFKFKETLFLQFYNGYGKLDRKQKKMSIFKVCWVFESRHLQNRSLVKKAYPRLGFGSLFLNYKLHF